MDTDTPPAAPPARPHHPSCPQCGAQILPDAPQGICPQCVFARAAASESDVRPWGDAPSLAVVATAFSKFEVLELIGRGGMGCVYKIRQPHLDRVVALKLLPQGLAADPAFVERFTREARMLARLNHPNIVTVFDFGQAGGFCYLLMEYVEGANLRQVMRAGRFAADQALAIVPRICEALQYAHSEGVLHRDIKPENILLDTRGRVKLADFGVAKLVGDVRTDFTLTATGAPLGTPHYMAPEQVEHPAEVDHRADIYSLGVVFYEMLTGGLPLGRFPAPSTKTPMDSRLDEVVFQALEKEKERRQQSADEVRAQVEEITSHAKTLPLSPDARVGPAGPRSPDPLPPRAMSPWCSPTERWSWLGVLAAGLAFCASFFVLMMPIIKPSLWEAPAALGILLASALGGLPPTVVGFMALRRALRKKPSSRFWEWALFGAILWPLSILAALGGLLILAAGHFAPAAAVAILLGLIFFRLPRRLIRLPVLRNFPAHEGMTADPGFSLVRQIVWGIGFLMVPVLLVHLWFRPDRNQAARFEQWNESARTAEPSPASGSPYPLAMAIPTPTSDSARPTELSSTLQVEPARGEKINVSIRFQSNGVSTELSSLSTVVDGYTTSGRGTPLKYTFERSLVPGAFRLRFISPHAGNPFGEAWIQIPADVTLQTLLPETSLNFPPGFVTNYWLFQSEDSPSQGDPIEPSSLEHGRRRWGIEAVLTSVPLSSMTPVTLPNESIRPASGAQGVATGGGEVVTHGAINRTISLKPGRTNFLTDLVLGLDLGKNANLRKVTVRRADGSQNTVDVKALIEANDRTTDVPLRDGDRIEIRELVF